MKKLKKVVKIFLDERTGCVQPRYPGAVKDKQIVSFDIFDTLIKRSLGSPEKLLRKLGSELCIEGFYEERIRAEKIAREKKHGGEVDIFDIYRCFRVPSGYTGDMLCEREIREELEECFMNPKIERFYSKCVKNKRVILVSDMYLPKKVIESMLRKCRITGYERIFISCAEGVSKRSGDLYTHVVKELGARPRDIVHIGNDILTDWLCAKKKGLCCVKIRTERY